MYAFCAPKIIGGVNAPTPVGELGMNQMTQAIDLIDISYEQVNSLCPISNSHVFPVNYMFSLVAILQFYYTMCHAFLAVV